jgi:hypothetical protein
LIGCGANSVRMRHEWSSRECLLPWEGKDIAGNLESQWNIQEWKAETPNTCNSTEIGNLEEEKKKDNGNLKPNYWIVKLNLWQ